jgi:hypothetical protein
MQRQEETVHPLEPAAATSRANRDASLEALRALEEAVSAPVPGREDRWLDMVVNALDQLTTALETQAGDDAGAASLLSEIAVDEPRLKPRIDRLREEHDDLRAAAASVRHHVAPPAESAIDIAEVRDRLTSIAHRFRQHRAKEADLIFEAVNINLGAGD